MPYLRRLAVEAQIERRDVGHGERGGPETAADLGLAKAEQGADHADHEQERDEAERGYGAGQPRPDATVA